jgi:hypothetical protein
MTNEEQAPTSPESCKPNVAGLGAAGSNPARGSIVFN